MGVFPTAANVALRNIPIAHLGSESRKVWSQNLLAVRLGEVTRTSLSLIPSDVMEILGRINLCVLIKGCNTE